MSDKNRKLAPATIAAQAAGAVNRADGGVVPGISMASTYERDRDNALLSKFAGGLGNDWTRVRGLGAHIKGTNGKSQGVVPFLKVANDTAVAVNQGGKRKGA